MKATKEALLDALPLVIDEADRQWQWLGPRRIEKTDLQDAVLTLRSNPELYMNLPDWIHVWIEQAAELINCHKWPTKFTWPPPGCKSYYDDE